MAKTNSTFRSKIKRLLLDFDEDEKRIQEQKQKTRDALQRLRNKSRSAIDS